MKSIENVLQFNNPKKWHILLSKLLIFKFLIIKQCTTYHTYIEIHLIKHDYNFIIKLNTFEK
jgi:hypothetical protein